MIWCILNLTGKLLTKNAAGIYSDYTANLITRAASYNKYSKFNWFDPLFSSITRNVNVKSRVFLCSYLYIIITAIDISMRKIKPGVIFNFEFQF